MYSLVLMTAPAAGPDAPRHWTSPVTSSNYRCRFLSGHDFFDPALAPGESYVYTVKATLLLAGREEAETREVTVTAGETSRVSFENLFAKVEGAAARSVAGAGR
jgi:hypothetical protein